MKLKLKQPMKLKLKSNAEKIMKLKRFPTRLALAGWLVVAGLAPQIMFATSVPLTNASFEANASSPVGWNGIGIVSVYNWSAISAGEPAADGTNAAVCSQSINFAAVLQATSHVVATNELVNLTAAFGHRDNSAGTTWGGYWLSLDVVKSDGSATYTVANVYSAGGDPGNDLWGDQTLSWLSPTNLASLPIITNGITGTVPDGTADISSGTWYLQVLVGSDYPGGTGSGTAQAGVDKVRLDAAPAPVLIKR